MKQAVKTAQVILLVAVLTLARAHAAQDLATHNKMREEFRQAKQLSADSQVAEAATQRKLDDLTRDRDSWESEIVHYRGALAEAQSQLEHAQKLGAKDDIERWTREVADATQRLQTSESELKKVDIQVQAVMESVRSAIAAPTGADLITPGETLDVIVAEDDTLSTPYLVRRGGYIIMKGVGRIQVAGKDLDGAEKAIHDALAVNQIQNATITVEPAEKVEGGNGPVIYLTGEFIHPGPWIIPNNVTPTALTTILRSGGVTKSADLTRVRLLRMVGGQGLVEEVNVQGILDGVGLPSDLPLNPGDIIYIQPYANVVYVTGSVHRPGTLQLLPDDELTAYTAILRCGGFVRFANRTKVYVLRDRGNGDKQKIPVSIKALEKSQGSDLILEPKDIVVVPEKFFSF